MLTSWEDMGPLGKVMSRILPRFALRTGLDLGGLARDPAVVEPEPDFRKRLAFLQALLNLQALLKGPKCQRNLIPNLFCAFDFFGSELAHGVIPNDHAAHFMTACNQGDGND